MTKFNGWFRMWDFWQWLIGKNRFFRKLKIFSASCPLSLCFPPPLIFASCGNQERVSEKLALFHGDGCQGCAPQADPFDPPTTPPRRPQRGGASSLLSPLNRERTLVVSRSVKQRIYFLQCAMMVSKNPMFRVFEVSDVSAFLELCFLIFSDVMLCYAIKFEGSMIYFPIILSVRIISGKY